MTLPHYFEGKVVLLIGAGDEAQRGIAVALAQAGADVAIAGQAADLAAEAQLHSIANEVWALRKRSTVVELQADGDFGLADAIEKVKAELGRADLVLRCEAVLNA